MLARAADKSSIQVTNVTRVSCSSEKFELLIHEIRPWLGSISGILSMGTPASTRVANDACLTISATADSGGSCAPGNKTTDGSALLSAGGTAHLGGVESSTAPGTGGNVDSEQPTPRASQRSLLGRRSWASPASCAACTDMPNGSARTLKRVAIPFVLAIHSSSVSGASGPSSAERYSSPTISHTPGRASSRARSDLALATVATARPTMITTAAATNRTRQLRLPRLRDR